MSRYRIRNIGRTIQELREERHETQQELADSISLLMHKPVKRETINQWESGTRQLKTDAIRALSEHFECTADYLLGAFDAPKRVDASLSSVISYTHLTEEAVDAIVSLQKEGPCLLSEVIASPNMKKMLSLFDEVSELMGLIEAQINNLNNPDLEDLTPGYVEMLHLNFEDLPSRIRELRGLRYEITEVAADLLSELEPIEPCIEDTKKFIATFDDKAFFEKLETMLEEKSDGEYQKD